MSDSDLDLDYFPDPLGGSTTDPNEPDYVSSYGDRERAGPGDLCSMMGDRRDPYASNVKKGCAILQDLGEEERFPQIARMKALDIISRIEPNRLITYNMGALVPAALFRERYALSSFTASTLRDFIPRVARILDVEGVGSLDLVRYIRMLYEIEV